MSLYKIGSTLKILKTAAAVEELVMDKPLDEKAPGTKIIEPKHSDFLYYRARAISAGDQGPIGKDGSRTFNYNGNFDYFSRKQLEASYESFVGRNIFLDHNSESSLYSIGKLIDAVPVDDQETGEFYIEIVGKIDRTLHPEICRKIETGELNSTSMGCSVDESKCSICGHILHSDADEKCEHLSHGLGKRYEAEIDIPEANIKQGEAVPCFSINSGIVFNEDSIVGVPADPAAVIKTVLSNMRHSLTKKASLSSDEQTDFVKQFENLLTKVDENTKISLKAEFNSIFNKEVSKESSMSETNLPNSEVKKVLDKISALEMEQLESYIAGKTKKANEIVNKEVVANATKKEETFLSKIVAKVKDSFAAQLLEKKIETVAKEELGKEAERTPNCKSCKHSMGTHKEDSCHGDGSPCECSGYKAMEDKKSSISAKFNEDKNNVLASTWEVYAGDKLVLDASLKDIWGSQFETLSFADQKWATSEAYGKEAIARYQKEGIAKLADLWDVSHKLSKTAKGPELGPDGSYAKPSTGTDNKKHNYPTQPKFTDSKPGANSKGPAAPKPAEVKTETKLDMPGQEKGQTGPAAPKAKEVKTDYAEPKVEAEGKEVKTTPKNPEEKKMEKSEKEVETSYVAKGTEAMEAEEKGEKKEKSDKKAAVLDSHNLHTFHCPNCTYEGNDFSAVNLTKLNDPQHTGWVCPKCNKEQGVEKKASLISWASLTPKAQNFIKTATKTYIASGMKNAEAVAKAHSEFTAQETDMKKQAADKPVESSETSTLPDGTKEMGDKPEEAVKGTTLPGGAAPGSAPETSAQGDTEHKTPDLTKKPDEAVKGTTTPADHISNTEKSDESVDGTTFPADKKEVGDKAESAVKEAAKMKKADTDPDKCAVCEKKLSDNDDYICTKCKALDKEASKSESSAPIEAVQDKPALSHKTVGDKAEQSSQGDTEPKGSAPENSSDESVKKSAATEMPMPEDKPAIEEKPEIPGEEKPLDLPVDAPKVDAPVEAVSAFDATEKLEVGGGYSASKDKESKEIIITKDGKEVKRLPDGFGADVAVVTSLLKAVLGLPAEEAKPEVPAMPPVPEDHKEEPKVEEHPALQEAHEDELGIKESSLKAKEAELIAKEADLKAKEEAARKVDASKKFAEVLKVRAERCKKIVSAMIEKNAIEMNKEVYESERHQGTYLLDAQKKAFEVAITAKQKELLAMTDEALLATEKVVADFKAPVTKRASHIYVSPSYGEELSEDQQLKKIFDSFGTKNRPQ